MINDNKTVQKNAKILISSLQTAFSKVQNENIKKLKQIEHAREVYMNGSRWLNDERRKKEKIASYSILFIVISEFHFCSINVSLST